MKLSYILAKKTKRLAVISDLHKYDAGFDPHVVTHIYLFSVNMFRRFVK